MKMHSPILAEFEVFGNLLPTQENPDMRGRYPWRTFSSIDGISEFGKRSLPIQGEVEDWHHDLGAFPRRRSASLLHHALL